jgi:hypothetical protein
MGQDYWIKQSEKALFPDLLWARPEVKSSAGKLLIVGGHVQSFAATAEAYAVAERAGIGVVRVLLPDSLQKTVSKLFPPAEYAPSNPSGGFAAQALAELMVEGKWADGVLLAGDLGRNSESLAMLENFAGRYDGRLTITKDAGDFFCTQPSALLDRGATLLVVSMGQLQKLAGALKLPYAFTSDLGMLQLVELLHDFTTTYHRIYLVTLHQNHCVVATQGRVCTSTANPQKPMWRVGTAAAAATWWLQNPTKPFEALVSSVYPGA